MKQHKPIPSTFCYPLADRFARDSKLRTQSGASTLAGCTRALTIHGELCVCVYKRASMQRLCVCMPLVWCPTCHCLEKAGW